MDFSSHSKSFLESIQDRCSYRIGDVGIIIIPSAFLHIFRIVTTQSINNPSHLLFYQQIDHNSYLASAYLPVIHRDLSYLSIVLSDNRQICEVYHGNGRLQVVVTPTRTRLMLTATPSTLTIGCHYLILV